MNKNNKFKFILVLLFIFLLLSIFLYKLNGLLLSLKIFISPHFYGNNKKFWVGEKHKLNVLKNPENCNEKIYFTNSNNKVDLLGGFLLMNSSGRECLTAFSKKKKLNSTICFYINETPEFHFRETNPLRIETYHVKKLDLEIRDYPKINLKYHSSHPEIIEINNEGIITAMRPGKSIISVYGLDLKSTKLEVIAISNNGLINNYILHKNNARFYQNLMIVAHPDDETLWGGANLFKSSYFVVCLTNGYNLGRAEDFRRILKFTNNSGIILNYPDLIENDVRDDWSDVKNGILKDLSIILNYKNWDKIVTHGPDGTTGHIHHKNTCRLVTKIAKEYNKYNNLFYFGKFYKKNEIPKYLQRISEKELEIKKKEVFIYKSVRNTIYQLWFHMLPYENWILASKWK